MKITSIILAGGKNQRLDPQLLSFFNINDHSDLDRAVAWAANSIGGPCSPAVTNFSDD